MNNSKCPYCGGSHAGYSCPLIVRKPISLLLALLGIVTLLAGCGHREGTVRCMDGQTATGRLNIWEHTYQVDTGDAQVRYFPRESCTATWTYIP